MDQTQLDALQLRATVLQCRLLAAMFEQQMEPGDHFGFRQMETELQALMKRSNRLFRDAELPTPYHDSGDD